MKKYWILSSIILTLMLSACFLENPWSNQSPSGTANLPPDQINYTLRSFTEPFEFDTLLTVELELDITPYESTPEAANIIATLHDEQGNLVYTGKVQPDGSLTTILQLPAAPEDITLTLHAYGFETRKVVIRDMVRYSKIGRQMSILSTGLNAKGTILLDSDGDLIPDIYDAFPNDPNRAFSNRIPAEESLTIAFEDLFLHAQAGDADYNDFIAEYFITETTNTDGQIVELRVDVEAVAKIAGYNHLFGIMIDYFAGSALLDVNYIDLAGIPQHTETTISDRAEIVLFESTKAAVGKKADFTLEFAIPQNSTDLDQAPYNPYLLVDDTWEGHDIHLIGEEAISNSINPGESFQDAEGFPWALLVPVDWIHPEETQRIEIPYPRFTLWRESFGAEHSDWYLHYYDPYDPPDIPPANKIVFASDRDGDMEIYALDLDDGTLTQLTVNTTTEKHPSLSADGSKIAFVSDQSGSWGVHTMNSDGSGVSASLVTLTNPFDGHPSWNPDGTMIAYDDNYEIFTMNSDGSVQTNLTNALFVNEKNPAWSPDGTLIVYSSNEDNGDYEIYTMNSDGSGPVKLTEITDYYDEQPCWSPDGTQIAFSTDRDDNYEIYSMNSDGSLPVNLTNTAGEDESSPSWSFDGNSIAYVKNGEIYTKNSDGSGTETNITNDISTDQDPSW